MAVRPLEAQTGSVQVTTHQTDPVPELSGLAGHRGHLQLLECPYAGLTPTAARSPKVYRAADVTRIGHAGPDH